MKNKRLTARDVKGRAYHPKCFEESGCAGSGGDCARCGFSETVCERLCAYEESGLYPEIIGELYKSAKEYAVTRPPIEAIQLILKMLKCAS